MATWQQNINSGGFLAGIGGMNENAPRASDVNATLGMIRDNNDFARAGGNNVGLQALQGLGGLADAYKQDQLAERQKAFQQEYGNAFKSGDRNAMRDLAAKYPDQFENVQKGMGFIDDDHRTTMGHLAMNAQVAAGQGPESFGTFLKSNAGELNRIGVNPADVGQTYQQDPQGAADLFGNLAMFSLGPKGYLEALDKREGRDIDRGKLGVERDKAAETVRSNRAGESVQWANVGIAQQNANIRKTELQGKAIDAQIARETNQVKLAELQDRRAQNQREVEQAKADRQGAAQGAVDTFNTALQSLGELESSPGLSKAVGIKSAFPTVPGSDAANFEARLDTFKAQTFLPMVQSLKGMGALSDAEGKKLSDAVGALSPKMSEPAFRASIGRIRRELEGKLNSVKRQFDYQEPVPAAAQLTQSGSGFSSLWGE